MSLSWRQRRALHAIERALAEQDPELGGRLAGRPVAQPATPADRVGWSMFCVAVLLLATGLLLFDSSLLQGGLALLGLLPPVVLLLAAAVRVERCRTWRRHRP
jgi:hypothetical protein